MCQKSTKTNNSKFNQKLFFFKNFQMIVRRTLTFITVKNRRGQSEVLQGIHGESLMELIRNRVEPGDQFGICNGKEG